MFTSLEFEVWVHGSLKIDPRVEGFGFGSVVWCLGLGFRI